jgi:hypothetical protein
MNSLPFINTKIFDLPGSDHNLFTVGLDLKGQFNLICLIFKTFHVWYVHSLGQDISTDT